jgi:hypothetical protein
VSGQLQVPTVLLPRKEPQVTHRRLGEPLSRCRQRGSEENLALPGLELQPLNRTSRSQSLYQLIFAQKSKLIYVLDETEKTVWLVWSVDLSALSDNALNLGELRCTLCQTVILRISRRMVCADNVVRDTVTSFFFRYLNLWVVREKILWKPLGSKHSSAITPVYPDPNTGKPETLRFAE